jgi:hypothetical protein
VSSIKSIGQPIAKYLCRILDNVVDMNNFYVRNSFDFKTFINSIRICKGWPDRSRVSSLGRQRAMQSGYLYFMYVND